MTTISQAIDDFQASPTPVKGFGTLRIMDPRAGDLRILWNSEDKTETDLAREQFNAAKKKGLVPYRVSKKGDKTTVMGEFDPHAEGIIMAPPVAGG